jgi:hypothetical protein
MLFLPDRLRRALIVAVLALFLAAGAGPARAQTPETLAASDAAASSQTEVLVLGTEHLRRIGDRFEPSLLDSLIDRLVAFEPDAVAVETLRARDIAAMEQWGGAFDQVLRQFAQTARYHGHRAQDENNWTWAKAHQRADSLLSLAEASPSPLGAEDRRSLIQSLVAAYQFPSAALHWRSLSAGARTAQTALADTTAAALSAASEAPNEVYAIGLRLAHRLGHQRLYAIDDHSEKDRFLAIAGRLQQQAGAQIDSVRQAYVSHPIMQRRDSLLNAGVDAGSLLAFYQYENRPERLRADVMLQWRPWQTLDVTGNLGAARLALWEARNLRMAAHIQRVAAEAPGGRVLVVVGTSHKPFLDALLRKAMNVEVVNAHEVLTTP